MQRRLTGNCYIFGTVVYIVMACILTGMALSRNYDFFIRSEDMGTDESLIAMLLFDIIVGIFVYLAVQNVIVFFEKVVIDQSGVTVTLFSRIVFEAVWEEIEEMGLWVSYDPSIVKTIGVLYFSKQKLNWKPGRFEWEIGRRFTNSRIVFITDVITEILTSEMMKYIPTERLIWIKGKFFSQEKFNYFKYGISWNKKEVK